MENVNENLTDSITKHEDLSDTAQSSKDKKIE